MKILLLCLTLIFCLCGCAGEPAANSSVTTTQAAETTTQPTTVAKPTVPAQGEAVADAAAVEAALGYIMKLPAKAEQVSWYVDAEAEAAYVSFVFEETAFFWMMGEQLPEFNGEEMPHTNRTNWMNYPYTVCWNDDGEGHAIWEDTLQNAKCHLFALEGADGDTLAELAVMLLPAA